jgi:hypothetical protein
MLVAAAAPVLAATESAATQQLQQQQQQLGGADQATAAHIQGQGLSYQQVPKHQLQTTYKSLQKIVKQLPAGQSQQEKQASSAAERSNVTTGRPESRILRAELAAPAPTPW